MCRPSYDIIIVGAGIAGSSAALALAPAGYQILLVDRAVFPRDHEISLKLIGLVRAFPVTQAEATPIQGTEGGIRHRGR